MTFWGHHHHHHIQVYARAALEHLTHLLVREVRGNDEGGDGGGINDVHRYYSPTTRGGKSRHTSPPLSSPQPP